MIFFLLLLLTSVFASNISFDSVQSVQVCELANILPAPVGISSNVLMNRLAWPVNGPVVEVPMIVNTIDPVGDPDVICLSGCASPPCYPISRCNPGDLWWSTRYTDLIVEPNSNLRLPNSVNPLPPVFMMLYDQYIPAPSPSATPSASPSYLASPSLSPNATTLPTPSISVAFCDMRYSNGAIAILSVLLIFSLMCIGCISRAWYLTRMNVSCPYCAIKQPVQNLQEHLRMCPAHLTKFEPIVFDKVHVRVTNAATAAEVVEDSVAVPESVLLSPKA